MEPIYDVAIIGGGPAGSTAAITLARRGYRVIVLEKEKFPRFHIGESLLPYSMGAFERLGVKEKLDARFLPKFGAEIVTSCGEGHVKFRFAEAYRTQYDQAYQVTRSEFDELLLNHAAEHGAEVRQETLVHAIEFGPEQVGLTLQHAGGTYQISARYVIDCSGRSSVIGKFFQLRQSYKNLKKFAVFAHYENVGRSPGNEGTYTRLVRASDCWFWMIPLSDTLMSIGVVMDLVDFKALGQKPEEVLDPMLAAQPEIAGRMTQASRVSEVHAESDYSYRNRQLAGERWLLAGDAAGFIDPMFSTGVFVAIESAERASAVVEKALQKPAKSRALLRRYEKEMLRIMDLYLRFVSNWYRPRFIEVMTNPVNHFQLAPVINSMLAGNVGRSFTLWSRMQVFYLITRLQRHFPLCPRLTLEPKVAAPEIESTADLAQPAGA